MNHRLFILLALFLASACGGNETETEPDIQKQTEKTTPVSITALTPTEFNHYITVQGAVESDRTIVISPKTSATVESIKVRAGDRVKAGAVLAELDGEIIANQISGVETQLKLARDLYQRQKNLREQNIGSEVEFLQAETQVEALESQLATLKEQFSYYTITAPISGTIDRVTLKQGETVNPGTTVFQLVNSDALKITAEVSEAYITSIDRKDSVEITFPSLKTSIKKPLDVVSKVINSSNRTFMVEVYVPELAGEVLPNMIAKLKINDVKLSDQVVVPINTVQNSAEGEFVFIAEQNGSTWKAIQKSVETGAAYGDWMVIKHGITPGSYLITDGFNEVVPGATLNIINQ